MKKRRKPVGLHPLMKQAAIAKRNAEERAAREKWDSKAVLGQIHALTGDDREVLVDYGAQLFFVASGCALQAGWTGDEPDMRIVRASVNALDELAKRPTITDQDRGSLHAGMMAAHRVIESMPIESVINAANAYDEMSAQWGGAKA